MEATLYHIYTDSAYVYAATSDGLDIYDITSEQKYAYITSQCVVNTVWGNSDKVFIGTTTSGINYFYKTCISGSVDDPYDISECLNPLSDLTYYSTLTSDTIRYLHGYDDTLLVITDSGVDVIKLDPQSFRSYTTMSGRKGFMTSVNKFYYTTTDSINRMNNDTYDWSIPDITYATGSGIFEAGITINDIFVTEGTSQDGIEDTLFVATSSGVYVIDEGIGEYIIYYKE